MQQVSQNSFNANQRVRGFLYTLSAFATLEVARQLLLPSSGWYVELFPSVFGGVIFLIAFFSLNDQKYKKYAQGALLGWLAYVVLALGFRIIIMTLK